MSTAISHSDATKPHIPSWKRLGLKLKYVLDTPLPDSILTIAAIVEPESKRKREEAEEIRESSRIKKLKKKAEPNNQSTSATTTVPSPIIPALKRQKSVTFTPETKAEDGDSIKQIFGDWVAEQRKTDPSFASTTLRPAFSILEPSNVQEEIDPTLDESERRVKRVKKPVKEKAKRQTAIPVKVVKPTKRLDPALSYLKKYHYSKENWKFNKVYQIHLLKHAFDLEKVPSAYIEFFYVYVAGLQGGARKQLRDAAIAVKVKDIEEATATEGTPEEMENSERKKRDFEAALKEHVATMTALDVGPNVGYEEGVLLGLSDYAMKERMAKRMRADKILEELAQDADEFSSTNTSAPSRASEDDESQKRLKMSDGSTQKLKRKRKQRTNAVEDISSSSSSESSSSEEDNSNAEGGDRGRDGGTESSSSSSSSSSSADSSSDGDSESQSSDSGSVSNDSD